MAAKTLKTRIQHKHDTEANWLLATNFIPMQGEIIIYDPDATHTTSRIKVGDGYSYVNDLPFINREHNVKTVSFASDIATSGVVSGFFSTQIDGSDNTLENSLHITTSSSSPTIFSFKENLITNLILNEANSTNSDKVEITNDNGILRISYKTHANNHPTVNVKLTFNVDFLSNLEIDFSRDVVFCPIVQECCPDYSYDFERNLTVSAGAPDGPLVQSSLAFNNVTPNNIHANAATNWSGQIHHSREYRTITLFINSLDFNRVFNIYPVITYKDELKKWTSDNFVCNGFVPTTTFVVADHTYDLTVTTGEFIQVLKTAGEGSANQEAVQANFLEADTTSLAYIQNKPFGDFGDDIELSTVDTIFPVSIPRSSFTSISNGGYPMSWSGWAVSISSTLTQQMLGKTVTIRTNLGDVTGVVSTATSDNGCEYFYIGEVYLSAVPTGTNNVIDTSKILNFAGDASTRLAGIAWSYNTDSVVGGGAPMVFYGMGMGVDSSSLSIVIQDLFIRNPITRLSGKYLPIPKIASNPSIFNIDNTSSCFYFTAATTSVICVDGALNLGEVKFLTIAGLIPGSTNISNYNLAETSINGFTMSDINNTTGSVTLMIVREDLADSKLANWYLFKALPSAEDYTF